MNVGKQMHKNPTPTVDTIIQKGSKVLLVERKKDPFKQTMVLPGGFINEGEFAEEAAIREVKEETSLDIELENILGVYSDPSRDPRGHIMSTVFIGKISDKSDNKEPIAGDDAATTKWVDLESIEEETLGFDHQKILMDFKEWKQSRQTYWSSKK
ncbi:Bifunctional NMN adenylyltransferase/Nudix hydrolase [Candidatus Nitrosocosmicus oleophilus]|uniref:Bifunctional NMN adenylyltransferase/Nudix hydrolase n=2 Tax=Candidatus Nitrosocosmicus oleophilus TaxID=1353260 RepID=A0A654M383_9ARCH|nr:Bifunctional NMN adenylyltransferase/Nudix hydrolase [Candidatus Nitrosocosmicus oleophilus]